MDSAHAHWLEVRFPSCLRMPVPSSRLMMAAFEMLLTWIRMIRYTNAYHRSNRLSTLRCAAFSAAPDASKDEDVSESDWTPYWTSFSARSLDCSVVLMAGAVYGSTLERSLVVKQLRLSQSLGLIFLYEESCSHESLEVRNQCQEARHSLRYSLDKSQHGISLEQRVGPFRLQHMDTDFLGRFIRPALYPGFQRSEDVRLNPSQILAGNCVLAPQPPMTGMPHIGAFHGEHQYRSTGYK